MYSRPHGTSPGRSQQGGRCAVDPLASRQLLPQSRPIEAGKVAARPIGAGHHPYLPGFVGGGAAWWSIEAKELAQAPAWRRRSKEAADLRMAPDHVGDAVRQDKDKVRAWAGAWRSRLGENGMREGSFFLLAEGRDFQVSFGAVPVQGNSTREEENIWAPSKSGAKCSNLIVNYSVSQFQCEFRRKPTGYNLFVPLCSHGTDIKVTWHT
ncbi:hypothetical protein SEVIR_1G152500v4 [Setaria viridis]|uniref:Uncharacterized protein n=2 Tax=Setaria TaxID=4554 RepID=A0A368PLJ2_SETIT|nr:hypothetical protein SETIT_1G151800v2 [Setaria italica]TKW39029.1 hypothetical protein SEVIR_1G152500v2 [Setaria viridis]